MSEKAVPPNPFDNPEFRDEFTRALKPLADDVAEHGRQLSFIKGIGTLLSLVFSTALWLIRGGK